MTGAADAGTSGWPSGASVTGMIVTEGGIDEIIVIGDADSVG